MRVFATIFMLGAAGCSGVGGSAEAEQVQATEVWTCPMHPEVRETHQTPCPICKMDLVKVQEEDADEVVHWTCPMHPSVREAEQTPCPLCKMDLTPVTRGELNSGAVVIDALRRQRFGIRTEEVASRPLSRTIQAPATILWDDAQLRDITIRADVWIHALKDVQSGSVVKKGQSLATLYSPDLYGAQREYLALRGSDREVTRLERLKLVGLSDAQVAKVAREGVARYTIDLPAPASGVLIDFDAIEGSYHKAGSTFGRIGRLDTVWVEAEIHEDDLGQVALGQALRLEGPDGLTAEASIELIEPWLDPRTRRATVRATVQNPDRAWMPDTYASASLEVAMGDALVVPRDAVVVSGDRRIVFVDQGQDRLVPRDVTVGRSGDEHIEVLSGVKAGDSVVRSGVFLVAAESRLRAAETYWGASSE